MPGSVVFSYSSGLELKWHFQHCCRRKRTVWVVLSILGIRCRLKLATALLTCFYCAGREWVWKLLRLRLWLPAFPSEALPPASWGWSGAVHNWWCKPISLEMWSSSGSLRNSGLCRRLDFCYQKFCCECVCGRTDSPDCLTNMTALLKWVRRITKS